MRNRLILCLTAGLTATLAGCMTALNTMYYTPKEGGKQVYGGVKLDAMLIKESFGEVEPSHPTGPLARIRNVALASVDLPLSAVGDTLTLPITIPASIERAIMDYYLDQDGNPRFSEQALPLQEGDEPAPTLPAQ